MPVVEKGWQALVSAVGEDGKLGYVQPIGADPKKVTPDMTEVYGPGAFLMAGDGSLPYGTGHFEAACEHFPKPYP